MDLQNMDLMGGSLQISTEVIAKIARCAALEVEGVSSLANAGKKSLAKDVRVKMENDKVQVDLSVLMAYGATIPEMGKAVQDAVKNAIESMSGLEVSAVNVNVGGITFPPKA